MLQAGSFFFVALMVDKLCFLAVLKACSLYLQQLYTNKSLFDA